MVFKRILIIILAVVLIGCLAIIPYVYVVENVLMKSDFLKPTIEEVGIYDDVYEMFMEESEKQIVSFFDENKFGSGTGTWFWGNVDQVMEEDYVKGFVKQNVDASVEYVIDGSEELATFDLMPKYEELKIVTSENLTMDIVFGVLPEELLAALKIFGFTDTEGPGSEELNSILVFLGIVDADGEINEKISDPIIESVFESNDQARQIFTISTTEELMSFVGIEDVKVKPDEVKADMMRYMDYATLLLPLTIGVLVLMLLLGIGAFGRCLKSMGVAFALSALLAFICSWVIRGSKGTLFKLVDDIAIGYGFTLNNHPIFNVVEQISDQVLRFGMGYLIIAIVLIVFSMLFSKKNKKELV